MLGRRSTSNLTARDLVIRRALIITTIAVMFGCQPEEAGETDTGECVAPIDEGPCPLDPSVSAGAFFRIYNPSVGEAGPWYINDHSFIRGSDGIWHLFGITHPEP